MTAEDNVTVTIQGDEYTFQGVTDLEVIALAKVFGTERPEEGTKEYAKWQQQFIDNFTDHPAQRAVAMFMRCAFPDIPERIVTYTVRRLPDGTEECRPGIDLRVKLTAKEFEQIILIIGSELKKIEQRLKQEQPKKLNPKFIVETVTKSYPTISGSEFKRINSSQLNSEDIALIADEILKRQAAS